MGCRLRGRTESDTTEWFLAPSGFDVASKVSSETDQDIALSIRTWTKDHYLLLRRDYSDKSLSREMFARTNQNL